MGIDPESGWSGMGAMLQAPGLWLQLAVVVVAATVAWLSHLFIGRFLSGKIGTAPAADLRGFTLRGAQRVIFPFTMLLLVIVATSALEYMGQPDNLLRLAVPLLLAMAGIRFVVFVLRRSFQPTRALRAWENTISTGVWLVVALHLLGWLPAVTGALDVLAIQVGDARLSVLAVLKLLLYGGLSLVLALWLSAFIETRLDAADNLAPGLRIGFAKFARFLLITIAVLVVLNSIGIDLTALAVFGGALGVGLGFGLQRIASNFVSGFILIFDRSIRPGDVITVGNSFGWVVALRARYVVVRNRDGVETLIPNENLITSEVINWSYSDRNVRVKIPVQVSYGDDPEQAMAIMLEAARSDSRVLQDPAPVCRLMSFGDNGIELELRVWITDPEEGVNNVRSAVNLRIWRGFKERGITIPFPQRDVHLKPAG